jgi:hypothetical protein
VKKFESDFLLSLFVVVGLPLLIVVCDRAQLAREFRTADRSSAGIAPPDLFEERGELYEQGGHPRPET